MVGTGVWDQLATKTLWVKNIHDFGRLNPTRLEEPTKRATAAARQLTDVTIVISGLWARQ